MQGRQPDGGFQPTVKHCIGAAFVIAALLAPLVLWAADDDVALSDEADRTSAARATSPFVAYEQPPSVVYRTDGVAPDSLVLGKRDTLFVQVRVDTAGQIAEVHVLHGNELLEVAAREAALQWEFTPARMRGIPVPVPIVVPLCVWAASYDSLVRRERLPVPSDTLGSRNETHVPSNFE